MLFAIIIPSDIHIDMDQNQMMSFHVLIMNFSRDYHFWYCLENYNLRMK